MIPPAQLLQLLLLQRVVGADRYAIDPPPKLRQRDDMGCCRRLDLDFDLRAGRGVFHTFAFPQHWQAERSRLGAELCIRLGTLVGSDATPNVPINLETLDSREEYPDISGGKRQA